MLAFRMKGIKRRKFLAIFPFIRGEGRKFAILVRVSGWWERNANLTYGILRFFQCFQKYFGFGWSDDGGEFLFRCFADALHTLEVAE